MGGRKTKAKLAIKPKPYIFCVPDSAGTQGTEGTIVPRAAFLEALEALDTWACIVASDALSPLVDVGYLRLNEGGGTVAPPLRFRFNSPA